MRILLINAWIPPSDAPTSRLLGDVGNALAAAGHEVEYLGDPGSYRASTNRNVIQRGFAEMSRLWRLWRVGKRLEQPDLIIALSSPPLLLPVAARIAKYHGSALIHWAMDVYPEIAVQLGVITQRNPITRVFGSLMKRGYAKCERLVALDDAMKAVLNQKTDRSIEVSTPWILPQFLDTPENANAEIEPPNPERTWLYSGNLGRAHDWEILLQVQQLLEARGEKLRLVIQGGGPGIQSAKTRVNELKLQRVEFRPFAEDDTIIASLLEADVLVATQRPETHGLLWPSKLSLLRHLNRPLLWIGPDNTVVDELVALGRATKFGADQSDEIANWLTQKSTTVQKSGFNHDEAAELREQALSKWIDFVSRIEQKKVGFPD